MVGSKPLYTLNVQRCRWRVQLLAVARELSSFWRRERVGPFMAVIRHISLGIHEALLWVWEREGLHIMG